jgi:hypothetical protein
MSVSRRIHGIAMGAALAAVATTLGAAPTEPAASRHRDTCATRGTSVTATERVRVYRIRDDVEERYYACMLPGGRARSLGTFVEDVGGPSGFRVAGRLVAFVHARCSQTGCGGHLQVKDVRTNRDRLHALAPQARGVPDMELRSNGALAWTQRVGTFDAPVYEVRKLEGGTDVLLDAGPDSAPTSLAASGATLYWTRGAEARSATFTR